MEGINLSPEDVDALFPFVLGVTVCLIHFVKASNGMDPSIVDENLWAQGREGDQWGRRFSEAAIEIPEGDGRFRALCQSRDSEYRK
jgi:hypothetical protein